MSFDREKFIEFLLKVQVTGEKLDTGAYTVYLKAQMTYNRLRAFMKRHMRPSSAVIALAAFIIGIAVESWSFSATIIDATSAMTAWSIIGAVMVLGPIFFGLYCLVGSGTSPLEGTRFSGK